jgi:uncharacterized membrane protein
MIVARSIVTTTLLAAGLALSACADLSPTAQRAGTGALGGAAGGALIGSLSGNAGLGAAIGAGVGAIGGAAWDQHMQARDRSFQEGVAAGRASPR